MSRRLSVLRKLTALVFMSVFFTGVPVRAGLPQTAVRESAETILRRAGRGVAETGSDTIARRLVARYGDDVAEATRKAGPMGLSAVAEAGEHAPHVARLLARHGQEGLWITDCPAKMQLFLAHGDETAEVMLRHGEIAVDVIRRQGAVGARAINSLDGRHARRLAMMLDTGELRRIGRTDEVLERIGRYGNRAAAFIWNHKGTLVLSAALAVFLTDTEAVLSGSRDLAEVVGHEVARPLAELPAKVVAEAARGTNWTPVVIVGLGLAALLLLPVAVRLGRRFRPG